MERVVNFCNNWNNKLNGNIFTTIRRYYEDAYKDYYIVGKEFKVNLKRTMTCRAVLIDKDHMPLKKLDYALVMLDTGFADKQDIEKLFEKFKISMDTEITLLVFRRVVR